MDQKFAEETILGFIIFSLFLIIILSIRSCSLRESKMNAISICAVNGNTVEACRKAIEEADSK